MTEKLKDNLCYISFLCMDGIKHLNECVYRQNEASGRCKYFDDYHCASSVANVNRMILHSKTLGLDMGIKDLSPSVYSDIQKEVETIKQKYRDKIKKINRDDKLKAEKNLSEFDKFCMEAGI